MEEICLLLRELIWHDSTFDSAFSMSHNYFHRANIFILYGKCCFKGLLITSADHEVVKHFSNQKFICLARRPHFLFLEMKFNFSFHLAHSSLVHAETARPLIGQSLYKLSSDWSNSSIISSDWFIFARLTTRLRGAGVSGIVSGSWLWRHLHNLTLNSLQHKMLH